MAGRTNVGSAQDRWANLETSFLLQRLEAFEGLVIITTNAAERIDGAFQRRMDVVIDFPLPEAAERARILALHLPKDHEVPPELVAELAARCTLAGGTLRNVVLHASLLAMEAGRPIRAAELEAAVIREYRKQGAIAPLRRREMP
jgi:SpoVK/Ycf46/Vps4 family AAA+-type ATPase